MIGQGRILVKGRRLSRGQQEILGRLSLVWQPLHEKETKDVRLYGLVDFGWVERRRFGDYWLLRLTVEGLAARDKMERLIAQRVSRKRWGDGRDRKTSE